MKLLSALAGLVAALMLAPALALAHPTDMAIGDPKAKVTVIEYASVSCPHCAHFNETIFPKLKAKYLDTGQARYILREDPIHGEIDVAGFLLARCAGPAKYFTVVDALFRSQNALFANKDVSAWLTEGFQAGGLSGPQAQACLDDAKGKADFKARFDANMKPTPVNSTPTLFVNGKKIEAEEMTWELLDGAIEKAAKAPAKATAKAPAHAAKKKRG